MENNKTKNGEIKSEFVSYVHYNNWWFRKKPLKPTVQHRKPLILCLAPSPFAAFYESIMIDGLVKSHLARRDDLWKKLDIPGVVSETTIWQHMWYGKMSFQIYNNEDRGFYTSITNDITCFSHQAMPEPPSIFSSNVHKFP